jgi:hypothetical protein
MNFTKKASMSIWNKVILKKPKQVMPSLSTDKNMVSSFCNGKETSSNSFQGPNPSKKLETKGELDYLLCE